jgi:hypothetical protein
MKTRILIIEAGTLADVFLREDGYKRRVLRGGRVQYTLSNVPEAAPDADACRPERGRVLAGRKLSA